MYESQPGQPYQQPSSDRPVVDAGKLWAGGFATAIVAVLIAVIGILITRGLFDIAILAPKDKGTWESASALPYAVVAAAGAFVATGLMHVLLLTTPRPTLFFGWIMFLVTVVVAVWPFTTNAALEAQVATAALNAIIVIAIWSLVAGTAGRALSPASRGVL
jgi:hypothetical protein